MKSAILLSGGPDSALLALERVQAGDELIALTLNSGEAEGVAEQRSAKAIAEWLEIEQVFVDFTGPLRELYRKPAPALMRKVPDWDIDVDPFGGGIALALASSFALSNGARTLYYGIHFGDSLYKDNTPEFFEHLSAAISIDRGFDFSIETPFLSQSKGELIRRGLAAGLDYSKTWSCGAGSEIHCGMCVPCVDRQIAFYEASAADPTRYAHPLPADRIASKSGLVPSAERYAKV